LRLNIIFDLDGTLINSSKGILSALKMAFDVCKIEPKKILTDQLIGPPLNKLLPTLLSDENLNSVEPLTAAFKERYDNEGYKNLSVFSDVEVMLAKLSEQGHTLYIATNKRIIPTKKIIPFLGWSHYFDEIYALDSFPNLASKQYLIENIMDLHNMEKEATLYIGDTVADFKASKANGLKYIMALWGYDSDGWQGDYCATSPIGILDCVSDISSNQI